MIRDFSSGILKAFDFDQLLKQIPELNLLGVASRPSLLKPLKTVLTSISAWGMMVQIIEQHYDKADGFIVLLVIPWPIQHLRSVLCYRV